MSKVYTKSKSFSLIKNKLSQIIKPSVLNNQTMCPFTVILLKIILGANGLELFIFFLFR